MSSRRWHSSKLALRLAQRCRSYLYARGQRSIAESLVPDRQQCVRHADCEETRQVDCIGTSQGVPASQLTGMSGHALGQLHGPRRSPVVLPHRLRTLPTVGSQPASPLGSGQRRPYLGIGQAAGHRGIAAIPQSRGKITAIFFDHQLDEGAAVEIHERHGSQRRWSVTRSATGPRARTRSAPRATGRSARRGLLSAPVRTSWSSSEAVPTGTNRATGVPRSVTTTSSPARTRSIQLDSSARKVVMATSIHQAYNSPAPICTEAEHRTERYANGSTSAATGQHASAASPMGGPVSDRDCTCSAQQSARAAEAVRADWVNQLWVDSAVG